MASKRSDDAAKAIAGAIAIGILGAAMADHHRGRDDYRPHPRIGRDENAVGTCMHHANKIVSRSPGGLYARLKHVRRVESRGNGKTLVVAAITGVYEFGKKTSRVRCVVKNHRIVKFKYN
ncbi:MAG: hypothetical protein GY927_22100 [bacterium]|nr:hypothetical protein [bacterium]